MKNQPNRDEQPERGNANGSGSAHRNLDEPVFEKFEDDDFLISDDMDDPKNIEDTNIFGVVDVDALEASESPNRQSISNKESNLFERVISDTEDEINRDAESDTDESWALNLLKNLDEEEDEEDAAPAIPAPPPSPASHAPRAAPEKKTQTVNGKAANKVAAVKKLNGAAQALPHTAARKPQGSAAAKPITVEKSRKPAPKAASKPDYPDYAAVHEYNESKPASKKQIPTAKKKPVNKANNSIFQLSEDSEPEIETRAEPKLDYRQSFENLDQELNEESSSGALSSREASINLSYTDAIDAIEPEPVDISLGGRYSSWTTNLPLMSGVIFASLLLLAQILWINLPQLSRMDPYRSYYAGACDILGCTLPTIVDRAKIRATNLVVRSHPTIANALIVDAVLQNSASFPQSFPDLDLIFTDVKDNPIAARRFTPQEYLGGELAGSIEMPAGNPVHIAVEIADPGPKAVGYRMSIAN